MILRSPRYPVSASPWRRRQILACAFSWWPLKKASRTHDAKRTTQLRHSGCTTRASVSHNEPSYTRIGWSFLPPFATRYFELSILPTRECHRWNHVHVRSYSGRAYQPPFRRPGEIDVAHATKRHRHWLRLLQRRLTRRRLRLRSVSADFAITADAITSSLVSVCRFGWTSTKRPRVHNTPEILATLPVFARCSSLA